MDREGEGAWGWETERSRIFGRAGWDWEENDDDRGLQMMRLYGTPEISKWKEQDGIWEENRDDRKGADNAPLWNPRDIQTGRATS